jgi:hypothetical protein
VRASAATHSSASRGAAGVVCCFDSPGATHLIRKITKKRWFIDISDHLITLALDDINLDQAER